jgi:hypothetical protein
MCTEDGVCLPDDTLKTRGLLMLLVNGEHAVQSCNNAIFAVYG